MLAAESPASFVAWDLLALGDEDLRVVPQADRRARLETVLGAAEPPVHLTPATTDRDLAADWFDRFEGAGLDGVVAKRLDAAYQPGKRAMLKIKHQRTADCVVAGFRWHKNGPARTWGRCCSACSTTPGACITSGSPRRSLGPSCGSVPELEPLRENALEGHPWGDWPEWAQMGLADASASASRVPRRAGTAARTSRGSRFSERVVEVAYDDLQGDRSARDDVQALASRPLPRDLPLRPARNDPAVPDRADLRPLIPS